MKAGETFKHCPFCGGQAVLSETLGQTIGTKRYDIECTRCPCNMGGFTFIEQALDVWNKRDHIVKDIQIFPKKEELQEISWDA